MVCRMEALPVDNVGDVMEVEPAVEEEDAPLVVACVVPVQGAAEIVETGWGQVDVGVWRARGVAAVVVEPHQLEARGWLAALSPGP